MITLQYIYIQFNFNSQIIDTLKVTTIQEAVMRILKKSLLTFTILISFPHIIEVSSEPIASEQIADSQHPVSED